MGSCHSGHSREFSSRSTLDQRERTRTRIGFGAVRQPANGHAQVRGQRPLAAGRLHRFRHTFSDLKTVQAGEEHRREMPVIQRLVQTTVPSPAVEPFRKSSAIRSGNGQAAKHLCPCWFSGSRLRVSVGMRFSENGTSLSHPRMDASAETRRIKQIDLSISLDTDSQEMWRIGIVRRRK